MSPAAALAELDELPEGSPVFVAGALPEGFALTDDGRSVVRRSSSVVLLTDAEIFGLVRPEPYRQSHARKLAPERAFADWQPGDVVVHEDYGIGIYRGLMQLTVNTGTLFAPAEGQREYLLLEYDEADRLYVPLHQLDRISRYVGSDDSRPALNKLGTQEWAQVKHRARGAAADMARDMLKLYAERELAGGYAFAKDTPWQAELEASFPYVETDDQMQAILDVKAEMERGKPMDRLICGDVGYGKTEVALRAAFKAVQDGKQVAVLVPTTVLAQQHWTTFLKRMARLPRAGRGAVALPHPGREARGARRPARRRRGHRDRHARADRPERALQGPGLAHRRRRAALRREGQGEAQATRAPAWTC